MQAQSYPSLNPGQNNGQARQTNEAEQVSMEEFLESCRATSLLAELEDDEELPDGDEEGLGRNACASSVSQR